jgi:predicted  nucleic acid-binding Zn-ribbon protein
MSQALHLHRLQLVDTQIDQLKNRLKAIQKTLAEDSVLRSARAGHEAAVRMLDESLKSLKKSEASVEQQNIHIQQEESSLYGGLVKNPKELKDLQDELASLRRRLAVLEDQELEAMVSVEEKQKQELSAKTLLNEAEELSARKNSDLINERTRIEKNIERLLSERQAILGTIPPDNLIIYDRLRSRGGGNAVIEVIDKSCSACGATLTPAEWQTARSPDKLSFCPSCSRILYAG